jgi:probable rRNA maturation factor
VLSFPAPRTPDIGAPHLGDIVIAYETLARESAGEGKLFDHHLAHLTVHGFLHLMGYDHQNDSEADAMERLESTILARLGVPDPYRGA